MQLGKCYNSQGEIEQALLVFMPGPNSYTGEDVVEIQCHGGALSTRTVLMALFDNGAVAAEPGEFTKRAFVNGKMDLTQAEAVMDLIDSHSEMALHAANRQLDGVLGRKANHIYQKANQLLGEIEVRMDFVDEDLDFDSQQKLKFDLSQIAQYINQLKSSKQEGEVLRHGVKVVLAGIPNAGKSSMMNLFLGRDRAIVTSIPGTTRDVLEEFAHARGIPIRLFDTAGIRETENEVEKIGVERSHSYLKDAQIILWLVDSTEPETVKLIPQDLLHQKNLIVVANKADHPASQPLNLPEEIKVVQVSALTELGFEKLLDEIESLVWENPHEKDIDIAINSRHADLLEKAATEMREIELAIEMEDWEIVSVALRGILRYIGSITGQAVSPDVLDNIFSRFCIGK
jgi:tRNA modification GTPase